MNRIIIEGKEINISNNLNEDYLSLTDMAKTQNSNIVISKWLSLKHTIDYLGEWESLKNPNFNYTEFGLIRNPYAHVDIALQFGMWISPRFQLLLVTEFKRLKQGEAERLQSGWDYRRFLSKTNYTIHTDAIKDHIIPDLTEAQAKHVYANEADVLNVAPFGLTAKQWREQNPKEALGNKNIRDFADVHQLIVLSNLESTNAFLIRKGLNQTQRLLELRKIAIQELTSLRKSSYTIDKIQSPFGKLSSSIPSENNQRDVSTSKALKKESPKINAFHSYDFTHFVKSRWRNLDSEL